MTKLSEKGHKWSWCGMCGTHVQCGTCGNNSCNGSYGEGPDGAFGECPDCPECYKIQDNPTKDQVVALNEFLRRMISNLHTVYTSRHLLIAHAKRMRLLSPLRKVLKSIDKEQKECWVSSEDISDWLGQESEKVEDSLEQEDAERKRRILRLHQDYTGSLKHAKMHTPKGHHKEINKCSPQYIKMLKRLGALTR